MSQIEPGDREEMLLRGILNGDTETNIEPADRKERLLKAILEQGGGKLYSHNLSISVASGNGYIFLTIISDKDDAYTLDTLTDYVRDNIVSDPLSGVSASGWYKANNEYSIVTCLKMSSNDLLQCKMVTATNASIFNLVAATPIIKDDIIEL